MGILEYSEHMREMFELSKLLPPLIRKNEEYQKYVLDTRNMNYKEDTIRKAIKDVLTAVIHEEFYKKVGNDYHTIPPK